MLKSAVARTDYMFECGSAVWVAESQYMIRACLLALAHCFSHYITENNFSRIVYLGIASKKVIFQD